MNGTNLAWLLRGVSIERAEEIWDWVIKNQIIPHLRPEMLAAMENHQNLEHRIFLISGSLTLLDQLTFNLGVDGSIATPLATENGHYTGKIIPPLNIGQGKVKRLKQFLDGTGNNFGLTKSFFYTESYVDAPVMELFGLPLAVYPNSQLAKLATTHSWPMIEDA